MIHYIQINPETLANNIVILALTAILLTAAAIIIKTYHKRRENKKMAEALFNHITDIPKTMTTVSNGLYLSLSLVYEAASLEDETAELHVKCVIAKMLIDIAERMIETKPDRNDKSFPMFLAIDKPTTRFLIDVTREIDGHEYPNPDMTKAARTAIKPLREFTASINYENLPD